MTADLNVGLFGGPGGWAEGMRALGLREVGLEWDTSAVRTRRAAGHATIQCDVSAYPVEPLIGRTTGLAGSPPCTKFSAAGKGFGRLVLDLLADGIRRMMRGDDCRAELLDRIYPIALAEQKKVNDERKPEKRWTQAAVEAAAREDAFTTVLVLEPARFLRALITAPSPDVRLEWAALEQVREVLPLWQMYRDELRRLGWSVWCGILNAADYGVPQTRRRALLLASRIREVGPPPPTHREHDHGPDLFGDCQPAWVSMAEALALPSGMSVNTRGNRRTSGGNEFECDGPSWALTEKARSWWVLRHSKRSNATERRLDQPAATLVAGHARHDFNWVRVDGRSDLEKRPLLLSEAAVLQSFRADYPFQGSESLCFLQIANAVPPLMAMHGVAMAAGVPIPSLAEVAA